MHNISINKHNCFNISIGTNEATNQPEIAYSRLIGNKLHTITRSYTTDAELVKILGTLSGMNPGNFEYYAQITKDLEKSKEFQSNLEGTEDGE